MTRIVVVNAFPVLPARSGGQQAVLGLTLELTELGPTELVWTERKTASSQQITIDGRALRATALPNLSWQRKLGRWLRRPLGRVDADIASALASGWNRRLVGHLDAAAAPGDAVFVLAHPWLWPALRRVLERRPARLVYDAHNVEHALKRGSLRAGAISERIVERVRRIEAEIVQRADLVLACTERDATALAALGGVERERFLVGSKAVAPSARADAVAAARALRRPGRVALFVGAEHPPNNAAARWIVEALAPSMPGWRFVIAGACGPASRASVRSDNVAVVGHVDDLPAVIADADVALNPVDEGSGINMKLFDYLQCGLPVVSTAFGARGFEGIAATGIVVAERETFATALAALDVATQRRLADDGVACVREHFVWPVIGARVRERIAALAGTSSR